MTLHELARPGPDARGHLPLVASAQLGSAEVIAEAPSDGTVLPLSNFGTVSFSGAGATAPVTTSPATPAG